MVDRAYVTSRVPGEEAILSYLFSADGSFYPGTTLGTSSLPWERADKAVVWSLENPTTHWLWKMFDCKNHIRVIQPMDGGNRLYICGTNAHNPKDLVIYSNLTHLSRSEFVPGIGLGIAKCPYDPYDNSTAIYVEQGNPGDLPALYSGTNAEFTKADTVIFRTDLYNMTTGKKVFHFKRTLKYDSKWLDNVSQNRMSEQMLENVSRRR
uniref:Sema domain-containing protein n=1 Tax=Anopheles farauti TaxID=69004 RepID=A0A182Q641_9DIPT